MQNVTNQPTVNEVTPQWVRLNVLSDCVFPQSDARALRKRQEEMVR